MVLQLQKKNPKQRARLGFLVPIKQLRPNRLSGVGGWRLGGRSAFGSFLVQGQPAQHSEVAGGAKVIWWHFWRNYPREHFAVSSNKPHRQKMSRYVAQEDKAPKNFTTRMRILCRIATKKTASGLTLNPS